MYSHLLQWHHQQAVNQSWQWFNYQSARVRIPSGTLLTWNKEKARNVGCVNVNVCPESFVCQQTWRLWGGKWGVTHGPAHALMVLQASGSPGEIGSLSQTWTVNIPLLSSTRPSQYFTSYVIHKLLRLSWLVVLQSNSLVDYYPLFGVFWAVCKEQWEEIVSD